MKHRSDIQGLRGIAVLLVYVFHLMPSVLPGGFVGVDVFFVISGYLITGIILHRQERGTFSFMDFYISRCKRILPLYYAVLLAVLIAAVYIYIPTDIANLRSGAVWYALFLSNNYLSGLDTYFGASSTENPLLHTWTLSIEMQFYFLLPLLLVFVKRKWLSIVLLLSSLLLFAYSYYSSTYLGAKNAMYFSLLARIPEFLIGALLAMYVSRIRHLGGKNHTLASAFGLTALLACAFLLSESSNFPGLWVLIPCLATALLLANEESWVNRRVLAHPILVHIGELSYAIYLIHWPIMAFLRYHFDEADFSLYWMVLVTVMTYLLSLLTNKGIENNFRRSETRSFVPRFGMLAIGMVTAIWMLPRATLAPAVPEAYSEPTFAMDSHGSDFKQVGYYGDVSVRDEPILLLGDSHARVYAEVMHRIGVRHDFNFRFLSNSTYPLIPGIARTDFADEQSYQQYDALMDNAEREIAQAKVIVIASLWYDSIKSLPEALDHFLTALDTSKTVIVLEDYPLLDKNPVRVNKEFVKDPGSDVAFKITENPIPDDIAHVLAKHPDVEVIELDYGKYFDDLPFYNDTLMYYDEGHLNGYGTAKVAEKLEEDFMKQFKGVLGSSY